MSSDNVDFEKGLMLATVLCHVLLSDKSCNCSLEIQTLRLKRILEKLHLDITEGDIMRALDIVEKYTKVLIDEYAHNLRGRFRQSDYD